MKLTTAILAASLFMCVGVRNGTGERVTGDTTIPKYRYVMKAEIPSGQYFASLDSIENYFLPVVGSTMTVDQAKEAKAFLLNQIRRIIQYARPDSVKIETKGGKP